MAKLTIVEDRDRVRTVTIDHESQLNALNSELISELLAVVEGAESDDSVGALVIRGAGEKAFCAGADLGEILGADAERARLFIEHGHRLMNAIAGSDVPVVAAVDGWALGGGMELALACDLVMASTRSRFGLPEAGIGCMPGFGGTQRIFAALPRPVAMRILLDGKPVDADESYQLGLLSTKPIEPEEFDEKVFKQASVIASGSKTGQARILRSARITVEPAALRYEAALAANAISSQDGQEGIRAFSEKRVPNFKRSSDD